MFAFRTLFNLFTPILFLVGIAFFCTIVLKPSMVSLNVKTNPGFVNLLSISDGALGDIDDMPFDVVDTTHVLFGYHAREGFIFLEKL